MQKLFHPTLQTTIAIADSLHTLLLKRNIAVCKNFEKQLIGVYTGKTKEITEPLTSEGVLDRFLYVDINSYVACINARLKQALVGEHYEIYNIENEEENLVETIFMLLQEQDIDQRIVYNNKKKIAEKGIKKFDWKNFYIFLDESILHIDTTEKQLILKFIAVLYGMIYKV